MTDLDRAVSTVTEALAFRLRNRDAYPDDPELFAKDFVQAMLGHGWRPTEARRHDWRDEPVGSGEPSEETRQVIAELRAKLAERDR